jgi:hypothetical protein
VSSILNEITECNPGLQELKQELNKAATLKAMALTGFKIGMATAVLIIEETLADRAYNTVDRPVCPKCKASLESKGWLPRAVMTVIGYIAWKRKVWRCPDGCRTGQTAPFDSELGLRPNQRTGDDIKQIACVPAVFLPFNIAALLLKTLLGTEVSPSAVWNWTQYAGEEAMARLEKELAELKNKLPATEEIEAETALLPLITGGDGVMVPFRPNEGSPEGKSVRKEVKVGILARLGTRINRKGKKVSMIVRKRVTAVLGDIEEFKTRMRPASLKEGILEAEAVVWLSDGGRGYWGVFYDLFAKHAKGVPDFCHAAQNLWKGARAWFDGRTVKARKRFECARKRLRMGRAGGVANEINAELESENLPDSVRNSLENLANCLEKHKEHTDYERYKELGLPIGSGMVESACKWLIQQRFKCVGMRWSENGFNNLLHLRLAWMNKSYDQLFEPICSPNS